MGRVSDVTPQTEIIQKERGVVTNRLSFTHCGLMCGYLPFRPT